MMYQLHSYDKEKKTTKQLIRSMKKARRQYKVAVYMGEFNPTVFCGDAVSLMDSALISYTLWNYKTTSYKDSDWGLYNKSLAINDIAAGFFGRSKEQNTRRKRTKNTVARKSFAAGAL